MASKARLEVFDDDAQPLNGNGAVVDYWYCSKEEPPCLWVDIPDQPAGTHRAVRIDLKGLLEELGIPFMYREMVP